MDKSDDQIFLQGKELGFGWTLVLDQESGTMSATLVNRAGAVVLFGSCTPQRRRPGKPCSGPVTQYNPRECAADAFHFHCAPTARPG